MNFIKEIKSKLLNQQTKTVYRYVTDEELEFFLSEDTSMLGSKYKGEKLSNSHKYKDEEYLHFFDTQNLPTRVLNSLPGEKTHICSFEIDKHTLNKYIVSSRHRSGGRHLKWWLSAAKGGEIRLDIIFLYAK